MVEVGHDAGQGSALSELDLYTQPVRKMDRPLVGRDKEIIKLKAALCRPEYSNVILLAGAGSGKAQPDDTLVPVADARGYVPIGRLHPGDMVFDETGKAVQVLGVFPQGYRRCFEVQLEDGTSSFCNDEHLWAARADNDTAYHVHTLRDLIDGMDRGVSWRIPAAKAVRRADSVNPEVRYAAAAIAKGLIRMMAEGMPVRIDEKYFTGSEAQRRDFVDSVIQTLREDKSMAGRFVCDDAGLVFAEFSCHDFVCDLRDLYASLGERYTIQVGNDGWELRRFFIDGKAPEDLGIVAVRDACYSCKMTCIYVEGSSHLYQSGRSHIVTHNTALVQGLMESDTGRRYLEVDLAKMIANLNDKNEMAARLKGLFDQVEIRGRETGQEIVLFMDEFHQVVQLSDAAVEALKPLLASSGNRGIKVIAATTLLEFNQYIAPNQPLVERLQRINLSEPGRDTVMDILRGFAKKYGVADKITNDSLYGLIYEYTNRYIPANAQPRKSILLLDAMVGYHRAMGVPFGRKLLSEVLYQSEGINVSFKVDATKIKERLDAVVFAQDWATRTVSDAIQVAVADLNDKSKPMCSLLFAGSTGVGKGTWDEELIPVYTEDGTVVKKRSGDLEVGDFVFNRKGEPVRVTGVYHRGLQEVYRVTLSDGRSIVVDGSHLWTWQYSHGHDKESWVTTDTRDLVWRGLYVNGRNNREIRCIRIPMNEAVQYPKRNLSVHPYVVGAFLGNGCLSPGCGLALILSSGDRFVPEKVCHLLGALSTKQYGKNYNWVFVIGSDVGPRGGKRDRLLHSRDVFSDVPDMLGKYSHEKRIPDEYKYGSIEQRWELLRGLFDTDGHIASVDGERCNVSYSTVSEGLAHDIEEVLWSLGVSCSVKKREPRGRREGERPEIHIHVKVSNDEKCRFFTLPKKLERAISAKSLKRDRKRDFTKLFITKIEKLPDPLPTTCIMVDDEEHLYQAGPFIVTHNTAVTKALAGALFGEDRGDGDENQSGNRNLIRMDMSEYSQPSSVERFRKELTARIWERPFSIVLLDEIEKACGEVVRLLLQVLDDGRLTDAHERQVVFTNAYIVLTTNASANVFKDMGPYIESDTGAGEQLKDMMSAFRAAITTTQTGNKFPPELLGRIDAIIPFQPLSRETVRKIVFRELKKLTQEVWAKHNVDLRVDSKVLDYIVNDSVETDTDAGGARQAIGKLRSEVTTPVAAYINGHPDATRLKVFVDGEMAWENKMVLRSQASVHVKEI